MTDFHVNGAITRAWVRRKFDDNSYQVVVYESERKAVGSRCVGCQFARVNCNTQKNHSSIIVQSRTGQYFDIGDEVSLRLDNDAFLKRCVLTYMVPLMCFLVLALLFEQVIKQEVWAGIVTFAGFLLIAGVYIMGFVNRYSYSPTAPLVTAFSNNHRDSDITQKL